MSEQISEQRLKELANSGHTKFYNRLSIPLPEVESMAKELLALRTAAEGMEKALAACHLQMLQSDNNSEYAEEANQLAIVALAAYRKAVGK